MSRLFIYPVKSAAGIEVAAADIDEFGFHMDRRWMIVRPDGEFVTQREDHRLALLHTSLDGDAIVLSAAGLPDITVRPPLNGAHSSVQVWDDTVDATGGDAEAADWITRFLGFPARLVFMPPQSFRRIDPTYSPERRRVSFTDGFPFLLVSEESVAEISRRSGVELSVRRFRPNIVVAGAPYPHAEDDWRSIRAGDVRFSVVKPCARCVVTTIDPDTGIAGHEPLRTLATYRRDGSKVMFGQNLIHENAGRVAVGDAVTLV